MWNLLTVDLSSFGIEKPKKSGVKKSTAIFYHRVHREKTRRVRRGSGDVGSVLRTQRIALRLGCGSIRLLKGFWLILILILTLTLTLVLTLGGVIPRE